MTASSLIDTGAFLVTAVWVVLSFAWPFVALLAVALWVWLAVILARRRKKIAASLSAVASVLPAAAGGYIITGAYFDGLAILPSQWRVVVEPLLFLLPYIWGSVAAVLLIVLVRLSRQVGSNPPFQGTAEKLRFSVPSAASPLRRPLN